MVSNRKTIGKKHTAVLFDAISHLIESCRKRAAVVVNTELVLMHWQIGKCINDNILQNKRAGYGDTVIEALSLRLTEKYGKGWATRQLRHFSHCASVFSEKQIVNALRSQLGWTHIRILSYLDEPLKRKFYLEMCVHERWSTRQLQERINTMMYERTMVSKRSDKQIRKELDSLKEKGPVTEDVVFKDPYILDFLGLNDVYNEQDIESAIVVELQKFIIELGSDFAFIARQKRITVDSEDYYIDLLFYHRRLCRLVAIDIKLGKFKAAHKGQMELYLRWLEKHEMRSNEQPPIGLILCADKSDEHVELMMLPGENIKVARYLTELPSKEILKQRLQQAIQIAKQKELYHSTSASPKENVEQVFIGKEC
jgi:predicted nuclease of restriction endonuclease-like (RecB) superfamily